MKLKTPIDWRQLDLEDSEQLEAFERRLESAAKAAAEEAAVETAASRNRKRSAVPAK